MQILDSLDEYMGVLQLHHSQLEDPMVSAEKFIAEAASTAFSPMDKPLKKELINKNSHRFVKPVKLSSLKKVLSRNPDYFKQ